MALQIKSHFELLTNLIDWITARTDKITDFNIGSAARTMTEAVSIQLEEFYYAMKQNVLYAIETSIYEAFDFDLRRESYATGYVTVEFTEPLPGDMSFKAGTIFSTSAAYNYLYYESTEDIYATVGTVSIMIPVRCKTAGIIGNVPANAIHFIVNGNPVIKQVYNATAITNGTDEETPYERKKRFQAYIKTLSRATRDAIIYGCLEVEGVTGAWLDDNYIGYARLYAHNSDGELPEELRQAILANMENYRAAGIEIEVLPIVTEKINLSLRIMIENDYNADTYDELIQDLIVDYMNQYTVASNFYLTDIIHAIKSAYEDVVINIRIIQGADQNIASNQLIRAGSIVVECVNKRNWRY